MRSLLFWDFPRRRLVICYRRLGTSYPSQLQGAGCPCFLLRRVKIYAEYNSRIVNTAYSKRPVFESQPTDFIPETVLSFRRLHQQVQIPASALCSDHRLFRILRGVSFVRPAYLSTSLYLVISFGNLKSLVVPIHFIQLSILHF
jgi:hypothetical protein